MKHGAGFRKLSKKTSHRMLMLRNMVTSLLEHEQIRTTLPKAREAARLAEKIITYGKNGDQTSYRRANSYILKPQVLPKLFTSLATRYENRPGGYTRIHKFGNRTGDHAPEAILELVDNPRDLKLEVTAKAIGWELLAKKIRDGDEGQVNVDEIMDTVHSVAKNRDAQGGPLRELTRRNLGKVLKFAGDDGLAAVSEKAGVHMARLLAEPETYQGLRRLVQNENGKPVYTGRIIPAGQRLPGMTTSATSLQLAQGALGKNSIQRSPFWEKRSKLGVRANSAAF